MEGIIWIPVALGMIVGALHIRKKAITKKIRDTYSISDWKAAWIYTGGLILTIAIVMVIGYIGQLAIYPSYTAFSVSFTGTLIGFAIPYVWKDNKKAWMKQISKPKSIMIAVLLLMAYIAIQPQTPKQTSNNIISLILMIGTIYLIIKVMRKKR